MGKVIEFTKERSLELNPGNIVSQTELAIMGMRLLEDKTLYLLLKTIHDSYEILGMDSKFGFKNYIDRGGVRIINHIGASFLFSTLKLPMTRKEDSMELYSEAYAYRIDCIRKEVKAYDSNGECGKSNSITNENKKITKI